MKIIRGDDPELLARQAAEVIEDGGVVAYPTDTSYGFAVDIFNPSAIDKVFRIKNRPEGKQISCIFRDIAQIKKYGDFSETAEKIIKKNLPGNFTFILRSKADFAKKVAPTIGARIPDFEFTSELSKQLDNPYTSTSANVADKPPLFSAKEIEKEFESRTNRPDLIIDLGELIEKMPSTVVDFTDGQPRILRKGSGELKI